MHISHDFERTRLVSDYPIKYLDWEGREATMTQEDMDDHILLVLDGGEEHENLFRRAFLPGTHENPIICAVAQVVVTLSRAEYTSDPAESKIRLARFLSLFYRLRISRDKIPDGLAKVRLKAEVYLLSKFN